MRFEDKKGKIIDRVSRNIRPEYIPRIYLPKNREEAINSLWGLTKAFFKIT